MDPLTVAAGAVERLAAWLPESAYAAALVGGLLVAGLASWYHPTIFLYYFDGERLDPWPQLLFTPAAYIGAWFAAATFGLGFLFVQGIVTLGIGGAVRLRHQRRPNRDDDPWPSNRTALALVAVGGVLVVAGVARSLLTG